MHNRKRGEGEVAYWTVQIINSARRWCHIRASRYHLTSMWGVRRVLTITWGRKTARRSATPASPLDVAHRNAGDGMRTFVAIVGIRCNCGGDAGGSVMLMQCCVCVCVCAVVCVCACLIYEMVSLHWDWFNDSEELMEFSSLYRTCSVMCIRVC